MLLIINHSRVLDQEYYKSTFLAQSDLGRDINCLLWHKFSQTTVERSMRKKVSFVMKIFGNGIDERLKGIFISPV